MKNKRLSLFLAIIFCCMAACFSPAAVDAAFDAAAVDAQLNATVIPDQVTLTWTDNPQTTQTITWRTSTVVDKGMVQYWESDQSENRGQMTEMITPEKFVTAVERNDTPGEMNLFSATLTGLKAGKTYNYRVGDGTHWSEVSTFTTENPKADHFKVLVFADSQNKYANYSVWHQTLFNAYSANKDAKFMINLGDMSDQGQNYRYFNNWFDASEGVINHIPEMPVMGNHETRDGQGSTTGEPTYYLKLFKVPNNGPEGYKGKVYSYDYGNAHFVVLDSQVFDESKTQEQMQAMLDAQVAWLDQDLASTDKVWKIVCYHKSPYYMKPARANSEVKVFNPVFDKYHVDLVLNGHDHGVARTYPMYNGQCMDSPAKGTVFYITGRCDTNTKGDLAPKMWDAFFFDPQNKPVYETLEISASWLTMNLYEQDGRLVDHYVIDKANPANSTPTIPTGRLEKTRLVLFGTPMVFGTQPEKVNGTWYIDFKMLLTVMNAKYDAENSVVKIKKPKAVLQLTDDMFKDEKRKMISVDALSQLGFECNYQEDTNLLLIEKINQKKH